MSLVMTIASYELSAFHKSVDYVLLVFQLLLNAMQYNTGSVSQLESRAGFKGQLGPTQRQQTLGHKDILPSVDPRSPEEMLLIENASHIRPCQAWQAWPGQAMDWRGLARGFGHTKPGQAWPRLTGAGLAWHGMAWPGEAWPVLAWPCQAGISLA